MNLPLQVLQILASDPVTDAIKKTEDSHLWPYFAAISALSAVVVALFGLLMRSWNDKEKIYLDFRKADEEKNRRIAEEFEKKDKALLGVSTELATLMERVGNELKQLNDRVKER